MFRHAGCPEKLLPDTRRVERAVRLNPVRNKSVESLVTMKILSVDQCVLWHDFSAFAL